MIDLNFFEDNFRLLKFRNVPVFPQNIYKINLKDSQFLLVNFVSLHCRPISVVLVVNLNYLDTATSACSLLPKSYWLLCGCVISAQMTARDASSVAVVTSVELVRGAAALLQTDTAQFSRVDLHFHQPWVVLGADTCRSDQLGAEKNKFFVFLERRNV